MAKKPTPRPPVKPQAQTQHTGQADKLNLWLAVLTLAVAIVTVFVTLRVAHHTDDTAKAIATQQEALTHPNVLQPSPVYKLWWHGTQVLPNGKTRNVESALGCTTEGTMLTNTGRTDTSVTAATLGDGTPAVDTAWLNPSTGTITRGLPHVIPAGQGIYVLVQVSPTPNTTTPTSAQCPLAPVNFTQLDGQTVDALTGGGTAPEPLLRLNDTCPNGASSCAPTLPMR